MTGDSGHVEWAMRADIYPLQVLLLTVSGCWMQPIRHSLGALLLEAGRIEEAEGVYRADLDRHADNVWSLHGLAECLRRKGQAGEAQAVEASFAKVAEYADVTIRSSCFCRTLDAL